MSSDVLMEFARLSRALGAPLGARHYPFSGEKGFASVGIDSRTVQEGALFVALAGESSDGHRYVQSAFESGARAAMVDSAKIEQYNLLHIAESAGKDLIVVNDTLKGLQGAARAYLEGFPQLIKIGITGSSGKTTTKEIAAAIIGREKNTVMNQGNLNSETGLPLSVFEVRAHHEAGIFELGMNRRGEIAELAEVLKPNIATITNIGTAHIGILGSKQAIAEEKKNIFSRFTGSECALIPADDEYREFLARDLKGRVCFYGADSFDELGEVTDAGLEGSEIAWNGERIRFALPGRHNFANALAALAIARELAISAAAVKAGMESVKPLFGRGEILRGGVTVIRDCYNANPESVERAIEFCDSLEWQGRKVYVIGDMLELGGASVQAHENIGRLLASSKADAVFLYGAHTRPAATVLAGGESAGTRCSAGRSKLRLHSADMDQLSGALAEFLMPGDLVLLKGSRGCALERLCELPLMRPKNELHITGGSAACF